VKHATVTLVLGVLITPRVDLAIAAEREAHHIRSTSCFVTSRSSTHANAVSRAQKQCSRDHTARGKPGRDHFACNANVLHSEELSPAPIFYHDVRATLRVTPPDRPAFEATIERLIPWQVPPPRRGQRFSLSCDRNNPTAVAFQWPAARVGLK
jgi:hypothetical protein